MVIEFEGVDLSDCAFQLSIRNMTYFSAEAATIDDNIATLIQPVFAEKEGERVEVLSHGSLIIETDDPNAVGQHELRLIISPYQDEDDES